VKGEDKSNEIPALPALLSLLDVSGCLVTIDAMGCQKQIARQIVKQEGDYVLALKGNQPSLFEEVRLFLEDWAEGNAPGSGHPCRTFDAEHGRQETRRYWLTEDLAGLRNGTEKRPGPSSPVSGW